MAETGLTIQSLVHNEGFLKKAEDVLGNGTQQFMSSLLSLTNSNKLLQKCDPVKLYNCCLMAAAIKLPFNQNLGQAYVIPYGNDVQLQIGWKGFIQLAQRSGQYRTISCSDVRKGEIKSNNRLTGEIEFEWRDDALRNDLPVVGYVAYFELLNGYRQTLYMSHSELDAHAKKYSQTYKKGYGVWVDNFDAMARKTVIKLILSKFGPLSIDMQKAIEIDQQDDKGEYQDNKPKVIIAEAEIGTSEEEREANESSNQD